jgi:CSLREA domain-containing protein
MRHWAATSPFAHVVQLFMETLPTRLPHLFVILVLVAVGIGVLYPFMTVRAATFTVNSTGDESDATLNGTCATSLGTCTLRAAIQEANNTVGSDSIVFNIAPNGDAGGVKTINVTSALPDITRPVLIDGVTQRIPVGGCANRGTTPLIVLNGGSISADGLVFVATASGSVVRGLTINNFGGDGIEIRSNDMNVECNFIGTDATGTVDAGNGIRGIIVGRVSGEASDLGSNNVVGGSQATDGNLISGNGAVGSLLSHGVLLNNVNATGNVIQNNRIGTNRDGTAAIPNSATGITDVSISTDILNNLVSGNTGSGLQVYGDNTIVRGNLIGVNTAGTAAIGNSRGIFVNGTEGFTPSNIIIGGTTAAQRNVISGNISPTLGNGIAVAGANASNVTITGNYIGTNAAGTAAIPNRLAGISLYGSTNHTIGTSVAGARNVISGNTTYGIRIDGDPTGPINTVNTTIRNNFIGTDATGNNPIGNTSSGIFIEGHNSADLDLIIGGTGANESNRIWNNGSDGITMTDDFGDAFFGVTIRNNSINNNGGLAIDIEPFDGVNTNDANDTDAGNNALQNYPVITAASVLGSNTGVTGTIDTVAGFSYVIDVFLSSTCDPTGFGEGAFWIDSQAIGVDGAGDGTFSYTYNAGAVPAGQYITAALTNTTLGNTSEFSACRLIQNTPTISINDVAVAEGNAGSPTATFTVSLSNPSAFAVDVDATLADGTATRPVDYLNLGNVPQTISFNPGETTKTVTVLLIGDTTYEPGETFFVNLSNASNATISDNQGAGTIINDDAPPVIVMNNPSEFEFSSDPLEFTLTLSPASTVTASVTVATADGTATILDGDYTAVASTVVTFNPGETVKTVSVDLSNDNKFEADETVLLNLTSPTNTSLFDTQATGTILNDDQQPVITIGDNSFGEGNAGFTEFGAVVGLTNPSDQTITVNYTVNDDSATLVDNDYVDASGTITFNPGETSVQLNVDVVGDTKNEADESFTINLANPVNASMGDDQAVFTILNDDPPTLSIDDVTLAEGNSGQTAFVFTVTLTGSTSQTVSVNYSFDDGTATAADSDYNDILSGVLNFAPGTTTLPITVTVNGDAKFEPDETFTVTLANPTNATITDGIGTGTIQNDDVLASYSINDVTLVEGNSGETLMTFTVTLSQPAGVRNQVDFRTENVTATGVNGPFFGPGDDYGSARGTFFFLEATTSLDVSIRVQGDTTFEPDETFNVILENPQNAAIADGIGVGTIQNDDTAPTISIASVSQTETNGATNFVFDVTLNNASSQTVTVNAATADGTASVADNDYTALTSTPITFNPGETLQQVTVTVNGDTRFEPDETFTVNLSGATNATIGTSTGTGTIQNDDTAPTLSINDVSQNEGNSGTVNFDFTVTLSAVSGLPVTVTVQSADNTATVADNDYVALPPTLLTFAPGETTKPVTVIVNGDFVAEFGEEFTVNLSGATNATIADAQGIGTISSEDSVGYEFGPIVGTTTEAGGTYTFTIRLNSRPTATVTIPLVSSDPTEGVPAVPSIIFEPTNWDQFQTVTITGVDDIIADGAVDYRIILDIPITSDPGYGGAGVFEVNVTNLDDDSPGFTVQPTSVTLNEGDTRIFTVRLNTTPTTGSVTVQVTFNSEFLSVNGSSDPVDLVFTTNDPENFVIELLENLNVGDSQALTITLTIIASDAPEYLGLQPITIRINGGDNDVAFPTPQPVPLCALIEGGTNSIVRASVPSGLNANVFCRVLVQNTEYVRVPAEVGDQTLINAGVIHAVDVFGFTAGGVQVAAFNQPIRVCLQGTGRMFFRDATNAPRITVPVAVTVENGYSCAVIPNAGTVVLVR